MVVQRDSEPVAARAPKFARGTQEMEPFVDTRVEEELAGIVHDLKNPLAAIDLEASILDATQTNPNVVAALDRIHRNVAFMDQLIHDMLDACMLTRGPLKLARERVDVVTLIDNVLGRLAPSDRSRIVIVPRGGTMVVADGRRIERVLGNLFDNALKYSPADVPVLVRVSGASGRVSVSVIDRGPGLSDEEARRVFGMFERGGLTQPTFGHGIGLCVAKHIIEGHGGLIGVDCALGRGSRFFFELPAA